MTKKYQNGLKKTVENLPYITRLSGLDRLERMDRQGIIGIHINLFNGLNPYIKEVQIIVLIEYP